MDKYVIYIYFDLDDNPLYIGKTNNFIQRQKEHLTRGEEYMFYFSYIEIYSFSNELFRDIYELFLINKYHTYYNQQGVCKDLPLDATKYLEEVLQPGELVEKRYRWDCDDFLTKKGMFLVDLQIKNMIELVKVLSKNYPQALNWSSEQLIDFFNTDEGWQLFLNNYYKKTREEWYTEKQLRDSNSRFELFNLSKSPFNKNI